MQTLPGTASVRSFAAMCCLVSPAISEAVNTITFGTADAGVSKSVGEWGVDTAWPSFDNVRQSVHNIGPANVDVVRLNFFPDQPLVDNGNGTYSLNATAKGYVDAQLALATLAGTNKPLALLPTVGVTDASYLAASGINTTNWVRLIKTTQEYINSRSGFTTTRIASIEPFNEPDYWTGQGTPQQLNTVIQQLKTYTAFQTTKMQAGSTLSSGNAQYWYDRVPSADQGSSHLLGGSLGSYVAFMDNVKAGGKTFANPELHSLGEAIVGAEHGMTHGIWWADVLRARGQFIQASDGKRLGYFEDIARQSAAAVYRSPTGKVQAFAGGVERFGRATSYRFVSADADVYFNGIPVREYVIQTKFDETDNPTAAGGDDFQNFGSWSNQGAYADVDTAPTGIPALDGYRWKIVNAATGQVMEVAGGGTGDGALIRNATAGSGLNQKWNIVRTRNGYFELFNANSGRTAEVANGSLSSGASVRQWGTADNQIQQWTIESAGNGTFYLRNAYTLNYLTGNSSNSTSSTLNGSASQKWRFVLDNPTSGPKARYAFAGNVNDAAGTNHATAIGSPTYVAGPTGASQAIKLNGVTDAVQLPSGIANSENLTLSMAVKWDGGANWQRIFDFGNDTSSYLFLTPKSGDGTMRFAITTSGNDNEQILETAALPVGQWVNLTLTLGGNTGILYVNGKPQVAGQILLNPSDVAGTLNYLGKSQFAADPLFAGAIADFKLYDYALSQTQVMDLTARVLTWTGGQNNNAWDNNLTANFKLPTNATAAFAYVDNVIFNGTGTSTVTIADGVSPRSVTVSGSADLTFTGGGFITGPGSLTKSGTVTLVVANTASNTFTGGTTITAGTVQIGNGNAAGSIGTGPIVNNGQLVFNRSDTTTQDKDFGTISGSGKVVVRGGTVVFNATNSYTGETVIQAGTLRASAAAFAHLLANAGGVDLQNAGTFVLDYAGGTSPVTHVKTILTAGYANGFSSGQIRSTARPAGFTIGYGDNGTNTVTIRITLPGDADLDGDVDFNDFLALQSAFGNVGTRFDQGNFDYSAGTDFNDFLLLQSNFGRSASGDAVAVTDAQFAAVMAITTASAVPEPAGLFAAMTAGVAIAIRRRRRRLIVAN